MTHPRRLALPLLLALAALAATASLAAAERAVVFVLGGSADQRATWSKTARAAVEASGWTAELASLPEAPTADMFTCVSGGLGSDCVPGYLASYDVERAVLVRVEPADAATVLTAWVFRRNGDQLASGQRHCERCRGVAVETALQELVGELVVQARSRTRPASLALTSSPPGATVTVDGAAVGVTDLSVPVSPGRHQVRFELAGRTPEVRDVVVGDGETMTVDVRLAPAVEAGPAPPGTDARRASRAPWLLVGAGAALAVAGGVLFALDEDLPAPPAPRTRDYFDSARLGVGLGLAGLAAVGGGLLWRARSGDAAPAATALRLDAGAGGATVVLGGVF